jgi:hypothetical protein
MKKTVLILSLFVFSFSNGQSPLGAVNGVHLDSPSPFGITDGRDYRSYNIRFAPGSSFSESTAGPNQVWDISGLTALPNYVDYFNTIPTALELSTYPVTTLVCTGYNSFNNSVDVKHYYSGSSTTNGLAGAAGLTGYSDNELTLNYSTNNVDLGTFPKMYGTTTSDIVAGTYVFGVYNGTFTGTYTTTVDAYGTMDGSTFEGPFLVTRLKTVENLEINSPGVGIVGTFAQTTYRYYRAAELWPYVKSTNRVINIAAFNADSNVTQIEKAPEYFLLSIPEIEANKNISLFPNPATNTIHIALSLTQKMVSLTVINQLGKVIITKNKATTLDVSGLPKGVYFMTIVTDTGSTVKKFIKN